MKRRISAWLEATHGRTFELTRHFLRHLFDSDLVATPGEWARVAAGVFAVAFSASILFVPLYIQKYAFANEKARALMATPDLYLQQVRADELSSIALAMALTAVLSALLWQPLFPGLRDYLALASLPIRPWQIFSSKLAALLLLFVIFVIVLTAPPALFFAQITQGRWLRSSSHTWATFAAWSGACAFVFFGLLAAQGLLLNLLSARWFGRVSQWLQALVLAGGMCLVPLLDRQPMASPWWPPNWFVGLWAAMAGLPGGRSGPAVWALALAPALALAAYITSYHRYRKLLLESPAASEARAWSLGDWLIRRWIADPREQAMFAFMGRSLLRSRTHRLLLAACAGLAVALNTRVIGGGGTAAVELQYAVVFGPLTMAVVGVAGLRYLFTVPVALEANWIFQLTEGEGRVAWLHAVERFVLWCGVAPVFLVWLPVAVWALGIGAVVAGLAEVAFVLICYEALFTPWRKAPFACSYLPGKRALWQYITVFLWAPLALSTAALVFLGCVFYPPLFFVVITVLVVAWRRVRERRLRAWHNRPLIYEEAPEAELELLGLQRDIPAEAPPSWQDTPEEELLCDVRPVSESAAGAIGRRLRDVFTDLNLGLRLLSRKPGFAVTIILTIGLGLGLNTAFFTVYSAFCLKPVSVHDPYSLYEAGDVIGPLSRPASGVSASRFREFRARTDILAEVLARSPVLARLNGRLSPGWMVSGNYFSMLGAAPALGRMIQDYDDTPVMVLSDRAWRGRFGGDPAVLGRKIDVQQLAYKVIGVARPEFLGVATDREPDFWIPLSTWRALKGTPEPSSLLTVVRLKPGITDRQASAALRVAALQDARDRLAYGGVDLRPVATILPTGNFSDLTFVFLLAFAFTMAIPCANAANMMLARGLARQREIGVRLALGAGRGRLVRQLMTEALLLVALAGLAGMAVARAAVDLAVRLLYATLPSVATVKLLRLPDLALDYRVLAYMFCVTAATVLGSALAPALQATRWGAAFALRRQSLAARSSWLRDALVTGEVALCLMLLVCAGLLLRGTARLTSVDFGFDIRDVHVVGAMDSRLSPEVETALRGQSWVEAVAQTDGIPTELEELRAGSEDGRQQVRLRYHGISSGYLEVLRIPLVRGRDFTRQEVTSQAPVAIVSEGAASRLWPGEDPLGKTLRCDRRSLHYGPQPRFEAATVIGLTRERVRIAGTGTDGLTVYSPSTSMRGTLLVRGRGDPQETGRRIERLLGQLRTQERVEVTVPLESYVLLDSYAARAGSWLASVLGSLALLLTVSGMFAVMSFLVGQRTKEMGVRLALGATGGMVLRLVLLHSARLVAYGVLVGIVLALWGAKLIAAKTQFIALYDLPTYMLASTVVALGAIAAALVPALRAATVDPVDTLRAE